MVVAFKVIRSGNEAIISFDADNSTESFSATKLYIIYDRREQCFNGCIDYSVTNQQSNHSYIANRDLDIYEADAKPFSTILRGGTYTLSSIGNSLRKRVGFIRLSTGAWYQAISWNLGGNVHSLIINNKEVLQIKRNSDNKILYQL